MFAAEPHLQEELKFLELTELGRRDVFVTDTLLK